MRKFLVRTCSVHSLVDYLVTDIGMRASLREYLHKHALHSNAFFPYHGYVLDSLDPMLLLHHLWLEASQSCRLNIEALNGGSVVETLLIRKLGRV